MLKLQAVQAAFGDCFILRYGTAAAPRFMLIDGGPPGNYAAHLEAALKEIKADGGDLDLVALSHVDNDHVKGLNEYFSALRSGADDVPAVGGLWHNSFAKTIGSGNDFETRFQDLMSLQQAETMTEAGCAVNGVKEGGKLRLDANVLHIPVNHGFPDGLIQVDTAPGPIQFGNVKITIVGPTKANLKALQTAWEKWLEKNEEAAGRGDFQALANSDKSVPNLSSIMFLAEADGKKILFTGDGRSDFLLEGLAQAELLDADGGLHVDVLKLPHHGSDRDITKSFFKTVTADFYVVSADGTYDNPDYATLEWLVQAAAELQFQPTLVFTNRTPSVDKLITNYPPGADTYSYQIMEDGKDWLILDLD